MFKVFAAILIIMLLLTVWYLFQEPIYIIQPNAASEYYYNCYYEQNKDKGLCEVKARDYGTRKE